MIFTIESVEGSLWVMQRDKRVKKVKSQSGGKKYIKFLTSGGCFNGEIPNFMFNGKG